MAELEKVDEVDEVDEVEEKGVGDIESEIDCSEGKDWMNAADYEFREEVRNHLKSYFKLFCKFNEPNYLIGKIGKIEVFDNVYTLFERGQFGWWDNDDRCVIALADNCDDVFLYYPDSDKSVIDIIDASSEYKHLFNNVRYVLKNTDDRFLAEQEFRKVEYKYFIDRDFDLSVFGVRESWAEWFERQREVKVYIEVLFWYLLFILFVGVFSKFLVRDDTCSVPLRGLDVIGRRGVDYQCFDGTCYGADGTIFGDPYFVELPLD